MKKQSSKIFFPLILIAMLVLAACSSDAGGGGTADDSGGDDNGTKTLVYGRGADSVQLDPSKVTDGESLSVTNQIFDTLVRYEEDSTEVRPALAESWEVSDDGMTYVFQLRDDVQFHDGTDFNAEAVVYNFERWTSSADYAYYGYMFGASEENMKGIIDSVEATGDYEVTFHLSEPNAPFLNTVAMTAFGIGSPTAIEESGDDFSNNPVGTGPFVFEEWVQDDHITLSKNADYFDSPALVDEVIFRVIPDNGARFLELQSGTIDIMNGMNPQDIELAEGDDALQVIERPSLNVSYLAFNTDKEGPTASKEVRQAINMAINKEELLGLFEGIGQDAKNPIPPSMWGYNDDIEPYAYDVEEAKRLLAEGGYPDGFTVTLYTMSNPRDYLPQPTVMAQAIQEMLAEINVTVEIVENDWDTHLAATENGEHDMAFLGWTGDNGDPDNFLYVLLDKDNTEVGSAGNIAFYKNDELHDLLKQAQTETDQNVRSDLYMEAQEIIHEEAPWVPIAHTTPPIAAKSTVTGYVPHPTGSEPLNHVDIK